MDEKESFKEVFKNLSDGDNVTVETEYGHRRNSTVHKDSYNVNDPLEVEFVFGEYENLEYLVYTSYSGVQIKGVDSDGMLEANGDTVLTIINFDSKEWAGENEELVNKVV